MEWAGARDMGWGFPWEFSVGPEISDVDGCLFEIGWGRAEFSGWSHPCLRMVFSHSNWRRAVFMSWLDMWPLSLATNLSAVVMSRSSRVTLGLVMYLC